MQMNSLLQIIRDLFITAGFLVLTTILTFILFFKVSNNPANIALFYFVGIITISKHTNGYFYGFLGSIVGVVFVNCFFTRPYFSVNFSLPDYPFTFLCMLALSLLTSATTTHIKGQAELLASHEKQLMEAEKEKLRANLLRAVSHDRPNNSYGRGKHKSTKRTGATEHIQATNDRKQQKQIRICYVKSK